MTNPSENPDASPKTARSQIWGGVVAIVGGYFANATRILAGAAVLILAIVIVRSIFASSYAISSLTIPDGTKTDYAYSLNVTSEILLKDIKSIEQEAARITQQQSHLDTSTQITFRLPGTDLALPDFIRLIRGTLGIPDRSISVTIIAKDKQYYSVVRRGDFQLTRETDPKGGDKIDELLQNTAEDIEQLIDPLALAHYYYETNNITNAIEIIQESIGKSTTDSKWFQNLWGLILRDPNPELARTKFAAALASDQEFVNPRITLATMKFNEIDQLPHDESRARKIHDILDSARDLVLPAAIGLRSTLNRRPLVLVYGLPDFHAQTTMGYLYQKEAELAEKPELYDTAIDWYMRSASVDGFAMNGLASIYACLQCGHYNAALAVDYSYKAAAVDVVVARYQLALWHIDGGPAGGPGPVIDKNDAIAAFTLQALLDKRRLLGSRLARAELELGKLYQRGFGGRQPDEVTARRWLQKAAADGSQNPEPGAVTTMGAELSALAAFATSWWPDLHRRCGW